AMGGTFGADLYGTSALTANTWAHLAATYDGATMRLYVNGVQVASRAQTGAIATSTNPLQIGGDSLYGQYFAGRIDEVRIYNRALSAAEIQSDMSSALGAGPPDTEAPSAPGNLVATAIGVSQVHLSWTASTDNVGVTGYLVERQDPGSPSFVQVGTSTGTSYNDTGLVAGSAYSYRVRATDAAQNLSQYSGVASAMTLTGIAASDNFNRADGGLGANWTKPPASQNNLVIVNNQVGVDVEQSHNYAFWSADSFSGEQFSQVAMVNIGSFSGVIVRAKAGVDEFYLGFVGSDHTYSIYVRTASGYTDLADGFTETWSPGDIVGLEASGSGPVNLTLLKNGIPVLTYTDSTYNITGGSPGIGMFSPSGSNLRVDNWEGGDLGTLGVLLPETQAPSAPGNLVATAIGVSQVHLSWTTSTDNVRVTRY